jgi:hypothetical protein
MNHFSCALLLTSAMSLLYVKYQLLAKVHSFITSLTHLELGLCHNKLLHL